MVGTVPEENRIYHFYQKASIAGHRFRPRISIIIFPMSPIFPGELSNLSGMAGTHYSPIKRRMNCG